MPGRPQLVVQARHEIKHHGFRIIARREADRVRLITRNGYDLAGRFPLIVTTVAALPAQSCAVDDEAIACDERDLSVFEMIGWRQHDAALPSALSTCLSLMARICDANRSRFAKATLKGLLRRGQPGIAFNRHFEVDGTIVYELACALGCEGIRL